MNLNEMRDEAYATSKSKGWYEQGRKDVPTYLVLVHSEISEALEAWRETGDEGIAEIEKAQALGWPGSGNPDALPYYGNKPEGVAAEFADVKIRIGDMAGAYELDLDAAWKEQGGDFHEPVRQGDFPTRLAYLHLAVSFVLNDWSAGDVQDGNTNLARGLVLVLADVQAICDDYKIDLDAAVRAKMAFNKTRPWKHGGKHV